MTVTGREVPEPATPDGLAPEAGPPGFDYDVLVIGSGFGGSVAALRLTEKGYSVGVLEAGRRFAPDELPRTSWDLRRFLWAPALGCYGIQRINLLSNVLVLGGAGVGGGSLNYANTLYEPLDNFYADPQWSHITDWRSELAPFYDQAKRMLGVVTNPTTTDCDLLMQKAAARMGVADTYHPTPVGVYFSEPARTDPDPFFGGAGPDRTGCIECGECMTGCRHGAKNTLPTNYLYLAERAGARVHPMTTVTEVRPLPRGGYLVEARRTGSLRRRHRRVFTAEHVVFAAGTMGTARLLHRLRDEGVLPRISRRLGELTRTNSEAIVGAERAYSDFKRDPDRIRTTHGVAITSSIHPDPNTHIEPVRYGRGSNSMGLLRTLQTDGSAGRRRWRSWLRTAVHDPVTLGRSLSLRRWSERAVILLVMQDHDNSITTYRKRGPFGTRLASRQGLGDPSPTWIPAANEAARIVAEEMDGVAGGSWPEVVDIPVTAHFIGGCPVGDSPANGVIDPYHRLYGYHGLHVVDGSAITANLGVNPSLTITAQAERAMALWPNRGEPDSRPPLGDPYRRVAPVAPVRPAVPADAPGALRLLPLEPVR